MENKKTYSLSEEELLKISFNIQKPCIIFLYGDLWTWKTTLSQILIKKLVQKSYSITSPTYVYYNKYENIYHFDLYRLDTYDTFVSVWWEEILNSQNDEIFLIEWPQILERYIQPDISIYIENTENEKIRKYTFISHSEENTIIPLCYE